MKFGSDNQSGASQQIMETLLTANEGFAHGYGDDHWSQQAVAELRRIFECDELQAFFVTTGTVANCLALACLTRPWQTVLCHTTAHLAMDESTAPEFFTAGARVVALGQGEGKLTAPHIEGYLQGAADHIPHNPQAGVVSITQTNENGQVYKADEIHAISQVCKNYGLSLHMDGARFANALVSQNCTPAELTWKAGVDVLCLGATKCGALCAEAVIFFNKAQAEDFIHHRKRSGHLVSKGRLFGAQFVGWLKNDHWLDLARHANAKAAQLATELAALEGVKLAWPVHANQLFAVMSKQLSTSLQQAGAVFYEWPAAALPAEITLAEDETFVRFVTSFKSSDEEREAFISQIRKRM
jgi:threonine aldolase